MLLGLAQEVGYQTLVWVIISFGAVFAFGIFLLIINRFLKPKAESSDASLNEIESSSEEGTSSELIIDEVQAQKEIMPETLEEIRSSGKEKLEKEE